MASRIFGIDFGSDTVKIYRKGAGLIYFQKTMLALKNRKNVIAIGNDAYDIYGKAPDKIETEFPVREGVIASIEKMQNLVNCIFLDLSKEYGKLRNAIFYVSVSADLTDIEKKAFFDIVDRSFIHPKSVKLIDKPLADGIGADIDYDFTPGTLLVNIGAATTEISVISTGTIVTSRLFRTGGYAVDEAIIGSVRKDYNILIGPKTAEMCKRKAVSLDETERDCKAYGRDVITGLPKECVVRSGGLRPIIIEQINPLIEAIKSVLERTPPEVSAEIYKNGMVITGGTAKISGISDLIEDGTGLKVEIAEDPAETVIRGLGKIMEGRYRLEQ